MVNNKLKRKLKEGKAALGTFMSTSSPEFVEILGISGFDFVVLDAEHGPMSVETTGNLIRAAELRGVTPITRIRENAETIILRYLDIGAHGVQIPQISKKSDAENAVRWAKYYPEGRRGVAIPRAVDFGTKDLLESFKTANEETMIIVHCENEEGYNNLDEILSVPEIDVVFFGPYDMTQSLGIPQQFDHPKIIEITHGIVDKARAAGKVAGIFAGSAEQAKMRVDQGYQYIGVQMFETLVANACKTVVEAFNHR